MAVLAAVPFLLYAFFRTDLRGFDSYAFLLQACGKIGVENTPPLAEFALSFVPCNILSIKLLLFLLFFLSLCGIANLGSLFHKEKGWLAALFSLLSPSLFFEATKFENDQFAIPILIWAAYFFYRARKTGHRRWDFYAFAMVLFAAGFWYGAVYWLLAFALSSAVFVFPAFVAIGVFNNRLLEMALPGKVVEALPFNGIAMLAGLSFGFAMLPVEMFPQVAVFVILLVMQIKWVWFVMPFLSVGVMLFYVNPKLETKPAARQLKGILLMSTIFMVVVWGFALQGHPPHSHHWEAIDFALQESEEGFIWNDWSLGYWVLFRGGTPSEYGGGDYDILIQESDGSITEGESLQTFGKGIVLTVRKLDCPKIRQFNELKVYRC